jgi:hypothetical protein
LLVGGFWWLLSALWDHVSGHGGLSQAYRELD